MDFDDPKILITGATGFVGSSLVRRLLNDDNKRKIAVTVRNIKKMSSDRILYHYISDLELIDDWTDQLKNISCIVHCAGRAHIMSDKAENPLEEYRRVNVQGTVKLANQAAEIGVRRFIYISSVKVNGESTKPGQPFTANDLPNPVDYYGISKMEAEFELKKIAQQTRMEVVIIRPPLIYGKGVKANFANLLQWINSGVPLPFAGIKNKRSFVGIDNLVDFIVVCMTHPAAANETFLVSDGDDISTSTLIRLSAKALGKSARLFSIPQGFVKILTYIFNRKSLEQRIFGSLQVDIEKNLKLLNWRPPLSIEKGLKDAANDHRH